MLFFKKLRYKNFLSTGNYFSEIDFTEKKLNILTGVSGAGKSTVLDAMSFVLYGKPYRNIKKDQLVNSVNDKQCLVEIEFTYGGSEYMVRRGIKPALFEIFKNGDLVKQDAAKKDYQVVLEQQILKFNYKSFIQIVVVGASNFTSFLNLKAADRRTIIEELLDIEIFTVMANRLKERVNTNKVCIQDAMRQIDLDRERIEVHKKNIEASQKNFDADIKEQQEKIIKIKEESQKLGEQIDPWKARLSELKPKLDVKPKILTLVKKLESEKVGCEIRTRDAKKDVQYFSTNDTCVTCQQKIDEDFKNAVIQKRTLEINTEAFVAKTATEKLAELKAKTDAIALLEENIRTLERKISDATTGQASCARVLANIEETIKKLSQRVDASASHTAIDSLRESIDKKTAEKETLLEEKSVLDTVNVLLKDGGIKTQIIKQYIPIINKYANKFLEQMHFPIGFEIDETFNDKIVYRGRDEFSYGNLSEGEAQRVNLALLFTWRVVAKVKNSVNTNILIMDEVFDSYLDGATTECVLSLLRSKLFENTNIFVISHKENIVDKFDRNISFIKENGFSRIDNEDS